MYRFNKHIAVFLLLISSLFIVPKELLHELSFHKDTHDCAISINDGLAVSNAHHHCDILQVFVSPYNSSDQIFQFSETAKLVSQYFFNTPSVSFEIADFFVIRGPPAEVSAC